jgi:transaldolase
MARPQNRQMKHFTLATIATHEGPTAAVGQVPATFLYVKELIAPLTVNTVPESTLKALADHGELGPELTSHRSSPHGTSCSMVIASKSASLAKAS